MKQIAIGLAAGLAASLSACSPTNLAENSLASSLATGTGGTFQSDDDPELVGEALPFALKLMESLAADLPRHEKLLRALDSGFTGYAYAFVQEPGDEAGDPAREQALHERARKLFLRARGYGLRALDVDHAGLREALLAADAQARRKALAGTVAADVPDLYWTAAAWGLAISDSKSDVAMIGQLPAVADLAERALALDPDWDGGTLHEFFVSFDAARGKADDAKKHYERALALDHGTRLGLQVSYAENLLVPAQDRVGFVKLLDRVLEFDVDRPDARPNRLENVLAQRRAKWLLGRVDDLFL